MKNTTQISVSIFCRTCQSCGHVQRAKSPAYGQALTQAYKEARCRNCRSSDMDYGHSGWTIENGKIIPFAYNEE